MKKLWFKAKNYGWGWYPCSREGWLTLLGFLFLLFAGEFVMITVIDNANTDAIAAAFILYSTVLVMVLVTICWKTGEKPEWRWGQRKKRKE